MVGHRKASGFRTTWWLSVVAVVKTAQQRGGVALEVQTQGCSSQMEFEMIGVGVVVEPQLRKLMSSHKRMSQGKHIHPSLG